MGNMVAIRALFASRGEIVLRDHQELTPLQRKQQSKLGLVGEHPLAKSLAEKIEDPKLDLPDGARRAGFPRVETPMPGTLSRLMSHSRKLARETQDL